jgi:hypothetical protein
VDTDKGTALPDVRQIQFSDHTLPASEADETVEISVLSEEHQRGTKQ